MKFVEELSRQGNWKYDYHAIASMMQDHVGSDNAINAYEIAEYLGIADRKNYDVQVKNIIFRVMKHTKTPIISNRFGYFIPNKEAEMNEYIANMRARIKGIEERISIAAKLYYALTPPM